MLPYKLQLQYIGGTATETLIPYYLDKNNYEISFDCKNPRFKPLLKSELTYSEKGKIGRILDGFESKEFDYHQITANNWINNQSCIVMKNSNKAIEYLYSIHYAFNTSKSLYIEKT